MATARQYWNAMKTTRNQIAIMMGADIETASKEARVISNATLATVAIVIKALVDKGVLTDADLTNTRNGALGSDGSVWDDEPVNPLPPAIHKTEERV